MSKISRETPLVGLALIPVLSFGVVLSCAAQATAGAAEDFLAPTSEEAIKNIVLAALSEGESGARHYLRGRPSVDLTFDDALRQAQQRSLQIGAQQRQQRIARDLVRESLAAFDPVVDLAVSYTRTDTFNRSDTITRLRSTRVTFDPNVAADQVPDPTDETAPQDAVAEDGEAADAMPPNALAAGAQDDETLAFGSFVCVTVDGVLVNPEQCSLQTEVSPRREFASRKIDKENHAWSFTWAASQLFPWGSLLSVEFETTRRTKSFFPLDDIGLNRQLSASDPIGQGSNFPWTTDFSVSLTSPLPFSRDFGPYGSLDNVGVKLARVGRRQADWDLAAVANAALRDVNDAYWELVRNIKQLQIQIQQREILETLVQRADVLYKARRITAYDKAQVDANLENIRNTEEIAWNDLIASSNVLVDLLDYEPDQVIMPVGYSTELTKPVAVDPEAAFEEARRYRPEIKSSQLALESSEILFKHRKVQTRPDLSLIASINLDQTDRVLGYESWGDSLRNVFDPDGRDYFIGVTFRIPFGNWAVRSALSQARISRDQAQAQLLLTENAVVQEINTIIATTYSTQSQITQTKASLDLAQLAYDKARDFIERELLSEFELLSRLNTLLAAKSAYIDALVDHRRTDAQLLAAQGILARRY